MSPGLDKLDGGSQLILLWFMYQLGGMFVVVNSFLSVTCVIRFTLSKAHQLIVDLRQRLNRRQCIVLLT